MAPIPTLTRDQMQRLYRLLIDRHGLSLLAQIERAGDALARTAQRLLDGDATNKTIVVLAGPGNNGAVGIAAARALERAGADVRLVLAVKPDRLHALSAHQYTLARDQGIEGWGLSLSAEVMAARPPIDWTSADLFIDALFGTGLENDPRGDAADLIRLVNSARRPILALELPSGVSGDEGLILSPCVQATATLALGRPLRGLVEGWPVAGDVWLADLGVPAALYAALGLPSEDPFDGAPLVHLGPARHLGR